MKMFEKIVFEKQTLQMFYARRVVLWVLLITIVLISSTLCLFLTEVFVVIPTFIEILNSSIPANEENSISRQLKYVSKRDFNTLIDVENFEFLLNHPPCDSLAVQPKIVILVHSAPSGSEKRQVIRETWGKPDEMSLLLFLVGTVNSTDVQDRINEEYEVS